MFCYFAVAVISHLRVDKHLDEIDEGCFDDDLVRMQARTLAHPDVLSMRESSSRPDNGIVVFAHRAFNQRNELIATCERSALMLRLPIA